MRNHEAKVERALNPNTAGLVGMLPSLRIPTDQGGPSGLTKSVFLL